MKKVLALLLTLTMILSLVACGSSDTANKDTDTAANTSNVDLKDITVLLDWAPNTNHTGLYVALAKGYYKEAGFNVSIAQPSEGGTSALVASGKAQYGIDFQDNLVPAFAGDNKVPVTAIAALIQHNTSGILSLKEKGIDTPAKMEGTKYATWDWDIEKAILKYVVEADGGDYSKITMIPSTVTDAVSGIQTDVDCVWVYYAWDKIRADIAEVDTNFIPFKDYAPELDYYNPVIVTGNDYMEENPDEVKAFLAATEKGYKFAMDHPDDAADILCEQVPELDKTLVTKSQEWLADQYQNDADHWGEFDPDRWNGFYNWLYEEKVLDTEIPDGTGFTNDYLPMD